MVRSVNESLREQVRISFDCDDAELPRVLRVVMERGGLEYGVKDLELHPLKDPAWNIRFNHALQPDRGSPLDRLKRLGLFKESKTDHLLPRETAPSASHL